MNSNDRIGHTADILCAKVDYNKTVDFEEVSIFYSVKCEKSSYESLSTHENGSVSSFRVFWEVLSGWNRLVLQISQIMLIFVE